MTNSIILTAVFPENSPIEATTIIETPNSIEANVGIYRIETDPIYTADKPYIALKSEISDHDISETSHADIREAIEQETERAEAVEATKANITDVNAALNTKVDKAGYVATENDFTTTLKTAYDNAVSAISEIFSTLSNKVDKITGKGLSTEDYTTTEKTKLAGIEDGAQVNPDLTPYAETEDVNTALATKSDTTHNHSLSNLTEKSYNSLTDTPYIPSKTSDLDNDSSFATTTEVNTLIENVVGAAPDALDTLNELAEALGDDANYASTVTTALSNKVDKEAGKGLSANDLTNALKSNYDGAVTNSHNHINKALLDTYSQTETNLADAVSKKHTHSNKTLLDNLTSAGAGNQVLTDDGTYKEMSGGGDTVKVSATDTTSGYLSAKLVEGDNITLTKLNSGGNETIEISAQANITTVAPSLALLTNSSNQACSTSFANISFNTNTLTSGSDIYHDATGSTLANHIVRFDTAGIYSVQAVLNCDTVDNNSAIRIQALKNGNLIPQSAFQVSTSSAANSNSIAYTFIENFAANDQLIIQALKSTDGENWVWNQTRLTIIRLNSADIEIGGESTVVSINGKTGSVVLTTSDIAESTDKRYCTDAQKTVIGNTSGTNSGDETPSSIKSKLGITTLSGSNTGDQTITLTGDVTGSGSGSFSTTLSNSGAAAGSYTNPNIDVNSKGLITSISNGVNYSSTSTKTASYTLTSSDVGSTILVNSSSATTITVPSTLSAGFFCSIIQRGSGQVTIAGDGTSILYNRNNYTKTAGQYAILSIYVVSSTMFITQGDMA